MRIQVTTTNNLQRGSYLSLRRLRTSSKLKRWLCATLSLLQVALPAVLATNSSHAQITVAPGQANHVIDAANGTPVININPTNESGLSHNQYDTFSVGENGVVFNNSGEQSQTQVAGWVEGNPNIGSNPADLILNEVTGATDSQLRGGIEVAGQQADVVIANPNGITCDGCGFINASHVQLTTGTPNLQDDVLQGYDVRQGEIVISGGGLDARSIDQVDLIARSMDINAGIWAQDLNMIAGANEVSQDLSQITAQQGEGEKPAVAIDVSALGGMYGDSIHLIGTEAGVGVNSAGHLQAITGDIQIGSAGNLVFSSGANTEAQGELLLGTSDRGNITQASDSRLFGFGGIHLEASALNNQGQILSGGDANLIFSDEMQNQGQVIADHDISLIAETLDNNEGTIGSQTSDVDINLEQMLNNQAGTIQAQDSLTISASAYDGERGKLISKLGDLSLTATEGNITNDAGTIYSSGTLTLVAEDIISNQEGARLLSGDALHIDAEVLQNTTGWLQSGDLFQLSVEHLINSQGTLTTSGALDIHATQGVSNIEGLIHSGTLLSLQSATLNNQQGVIQTQATNLQLSEALQNNAGQIFSDENLTIRAGRLDNQSGTIASTEGDADINITNQTNNDDGILQAQGHLNLNSADYQGHSGQLVARGERLSVSATNGNIDNQSGLIFSGGELELNAHDDIINREGQIHAESTTHLHAQELDNRQGQLQAHGAQVLNLDSLDNQQGTLTSTQDIEAQVQGDINNAQGTLYSDTDLILQAQNLQNTNGQIQSLGASEFFIKNELNNHSGQLVSHQGLYISVGAMQNQSGQIFSVSDNASVWAHDLINNDDGIIAAQQGDLLLSTSGTLTNTTGRLIGHDAAAVIAQTYSGAQGQLRVSQGDLTINVANDLDNQSGTITTSGIASLRAGQHIHNQSGLIASGNNLVLDAHEIINQAGQLSSITGDLTITSQAVLDNQSGKIQASKSVTIESAGLENQSGTISAADITLAQDRQSIDNRHGQIVSHKTLTITAEEIDNRQGLINANGHANIALSGDIDNRNTEVSEQTGLYVGGDLNLSTKNINNEQGQLHGDGHIWLNIAEQLHNLNGSLSAAQSGTLSIRAAHLDNRQGQLQAPELTLEIDQDIQNQAGNIAGLNALTIHANQLNNATHATAPQTSTLSGGQVNIQANQLDNQGGIIYGTSEIVLQDQQGAQALVLDNHQGSISSHGDLSLHTRTLRGDGSLFAQHQLHADLQQWDGLGNISSQGNLELDLYQTQTLTGEVAANAHVNIDTHGHQLNNHGYLGAGETLTLTVGSLNNSESHTIVATHTVIDADGLIDNAGLIQGGQSLSMIATALNNQHRGILQSTGKTQLTIAQLLLNYGLINGERTYIRADQIINTERLYGSHIAIEANSLINGQDNTGTLTGYDGGNTNAGVIASRSDIDLAIDHIINEEEALIFAQGNLRVGNALDDEHHATGIATQLTNASANIDVQGSAYLGVDEVRNENRHFAMEQVEVGRTGQQVHYIIDGEEYEADEVLFAYGQSVSSRNPDDPRFDAPPPNGGTAGPWSCTTREHRGSGEDITTCSRNVFFGPYDKGTMPQWLADQDKYDGTPSRPANYVILPKPTGWPHAPASFSLLTAKNDWIYTVKDEVTYRDTVTSTAPSIIRVGHNLTFSDRLVNDKSQIAVGGLLYSENGHSLENIGASAQEVIRTENAKSIYTYRDRRPSPFEPNRRLYENKPLSIADQVTSITLPVGEVVTNSTTSLPTATIVVTESISIGNVEAPTNMPNVNTIDDIRAHLDGDSATITDTLINVDGQDLVGAESPTFTAMDINDVDSAPLEIRTTEPDITLPQNAIYLTNPEAPNGYIIETDPAFTNYENWIGSDYMLDALELDPDRRWQRLGDGFYEQQLINQQVLAGTGRRFLGGYTNNEEQYKALMDAGIAFSQAFNLNVGTELTAEQMQALTTDIVWLVEREVTLSNGSTTTALVPKVYMRIESAQITGNGTLVSADQIQLDLNDDINNSGTLYGAEQLTLRGENIHNQNLGQIVGESVLLHANDQLSNIGGVINGDTITLSANTINIGSTLSQGEGLNGSHVGIDQVGIVGAQNNLTLLSDQDLSLSGAQLSGEHVFLNSANGDINLETLELSQSEHVDFGNRNNYSHSASYDAGTTIRSGAGRITINSDAGNINAMGATIMSQGDITLNAAEDINLNAGHQRDERHFEGYTSNRGLLSSSTHHRVRESNSDEAIVSQVHGANVDIHAGNTLNLEGTQVSAFGYTNPDENSSLNVTTAGHINLSGTHGVNIHTAESTYATHNEDHETFTGLRGQGFGVFIGNERNGNSRSTDGLVHTRAGLNANGNINILSTAGTIHTQGIQANSSDGNITLSGETIIDEAIHNQYTTHNSQYQESTGLSIGLQGGIVSAVQGIQQAINSANANSHSNDLRDAYNTQAAIGAGQLGYDIYHNKQAISTARANLAQAHASGNPEAIQAAQSQLTSAQNALIPVVGISFGHSESESEQEQTTLNAQSSNLNANNGNITLIAHGQLDTEGNRLPNTGDQPGQGNIILQGTQANAQQITLDAQNDIILDAAANQTHTTSSNSNSGWGVGATLGLNGIGINAHANQGNGNSHGNATSYQGTTLSADTITLTSGGDTHISGSQVRGNHINADIGGALDITSLQDSSDYHSIQENSGVNVGISLSGAGIPLSGSLGINDSTGIVNGDHASVVEQAGIYTGNDGLDLDIEHTLTLTAGVISSDAPLGSNSITTAGIVHNNIVNHAQWAAEQTGTNISLSSDAGIMGNAASVAQGIGMGQLSSELGNNSQGVSHATLTDNIGITIRGTDSTTTTAQLDGLNRDRDQINTGNVEQDIQGMHDSLELINIRQQLANNTSQLGFQIAGDIANSQMGAYNPETGEYENPEWDEGGQYRTLLHMGIAALSAALADGDIGQAALGAGLNQLSHDIVRDILTQNGIVVGSPEGDAIERAFSAAIGAIASGGDYSVTQVVNNATEFNRQLHREEGQWIRDNAQIFADANGLSREQALALLSRAALTLIDSAHDDNINEGVDNRALAFLQGNQNGYFRATNAERNNHQLNLGDLLANIDLYDSAGYVESTDGNLAPGMDRRGGNPLIIALRGISDTRGGESATDIITLQQSIANLTDEETAQLVTHIQNNYEFNGLNMQYLDGSLIKVGLIEDIVPFLSDYAKGVLQSEAEARRQSALITAKITEGEPLTAEEQDLLGSMFLISFSAKGMQLSEAIVMRQHILAGIATKSRGRVGDDQDNHDDGTPNNNPVDNVETPNCTGRGCGTTEGQCFTAGTPITTRQGHQAIETLSVGKAVSFTDLSN